MGKGTDKLYITHSEWSSGDQFSASAGAGVKASNAYLASFKRLPYNFCALSLQPFSTPVCTAEGQIFDHENIIRWLMKHNTNPTNGKPLKQSDLIKLNFEKNEEGDYVDPVTLKEFTDNSHIVAIRHGESANVFAYDTLERLNFKPKVWKDLVSDEDFTRQDLIVLQDPTNLQSRDLNSFKYLKDGEDAGIPKEEAEINTAAMGNAAKIMKAKEAVAKARAERAAGPSTAASKNGALTRTTQKSAAPKSNAVPFNATRHTTGLAAASLTSTGVTPHTSASLATMSDEEYLLRRGRIKQKGYVRLETSLGNVNIELYPEYAPMAVWNFIKLAQSGYYDGIAFHRNIRNFMIQGGDPTGTGKGGKSVWGKNFEDEFDGTPLKHDIKGTVSMANKGKDTNSSQFFITYRKTPHLDRKHTIFGRVLEGDEVLTALENAPVDSKDRPTEDITIETAVVVVDPFEEFMNQKKEDEREEQKREQRGDDDSRTTWTGKRIRQDGTVANDSSAGVGRYLKARLAGGVQTDSRADQDDETVEFLGDEEPISEPVKKKAKGGGGGFGNFDGW